MNLPLSLSGDTPGLLQPGCRVVETASAMVGARGVCVQMPESGHAPAHLSVWWETVCPTMVTSVTHGSSLDLSLPEGRDRAVRWLRERGHDVFYLLDGRGYDYDRGHLTAAQSASFLWWSVHSVRVGGKPVSGYMAPWRRYEKSENTTYLGDDGTRAHSGFGRSCGYFAHTYSNGIYAEVDDAAGWRICFEFKGPQVREEGQAEVDRTFLNMGIALLEADGTARLPPTFTTPGTAA